MYIGEHKSTKELTYLGEPSIISGYGTYDLIYDGNGGVPTYQEYIDAN